MNTSTAQSSPARLYRLDQPFKSSWLKRAAQWAEARRAYLLLAASGFLLLMSWTGWAEERVGFDPAWGTIMISGAPLVWTSMRRLVLRRDVTAGVLVSAALVAATAIGEHFAAGEVAFIMAVGELLEQRTVAKAGRALHNLASLVPGTARIRRDGVLVEVTTGELGVGDRVVVRPGESIPVDGLVVHGHSSVNQAAVTGESIPADKGPGDRVFIGTTNMLGALEIEATRVGGDTTLARVMELVRQAQFDRAPVVRLADRWASWLVPVSITVAAVVGVVSGDVVRAVTILIVFCPCALCLATPTAITAGIGNAATRGILIKSGAACEQTSRIDTVIFDKTGTLTTGRPELAAVYEIAE